MKVEVRCCCEPKKLLGWIELDERDVRAGRRIRFAGPAFRLGESLPIELFNDGAGRQYPALKAEHKTAADFADVRIFTPA